MLLSVRDSESISILTESQKNPWINQEVVLAPKVKETYYGEGLGQKRDVRPNRERFVLLKWIFSMNSLNRFKNQYE